MNLNLTHDQVVFLQDCMENMFMKQTPDGAWYVPQEPLEYKNTHHDFQFNDEEIHQVWLELESARHSH